MISIQNLYQKKIKKEKITMVTSYDFWSARIINQSDIDMILVGDSAAMVMHGHANTLPATVEMMCSHIAAAAKGAPEKFIVGDMPFLSFRQGKQTAIKCVQDFMQAGAHAVKLEGVDGHEDVIAHIVQSGVPVMGHLGLTPQFIHQLGGFKVQARHDEGVEILMQQAQKLQDLGCFSLVLECIPQNVAQWVSEKLKIPTIGIGAGVHTDGQVLVFHDLLGLNLGFSPKFLRKYLDGAQLIQNALNQFAQDVKDQNFPGEKESYL